MKFQKTSYYAPTEDNPNRVAWDKSQADAATRRTALRREGIKDPTTTTVEVPTDKAGLIAFLNSLA